MSTAVPQNPETPVQAPKPKAPGGPPEGQYTRRDTLILLGWGWLAASFGGWGAAGLKFIFPNVLYEPNPMFKAGKPSEYPLEEGKPATVDLRWQREQRVWIVTSPEGIYAFEAKCTHLGCTPRWEAASLKFKCPCHGSNFDPEGDVVAGPAPKPLYRLNVNLSGDGQLVVNKALRNNNKSDRADDRFFIKRSRYSS